MHRRHLLALVVLALVVATVLAVGPVRVWDWATLRTVKQYYDDGSLRGRYQVPWWRDANKDHAHGRFETWHPNGRLDYEGVARHGQNVYLKCWDANGVLRSHVTLENDAIHTGIQTIYAVLDDGIAIQFQSLYAKGRRIDHREQPPWFSEEEILRAVDDFFREEIEE